MEPGDKPHQREPRKRAGRQTVHTTLGARDVWFWAADHCEPAAAGPPDPQVADVPNAAVPVCAACRKVSENSCIVINFANYVSTSRFHHDFAVDFFAFFVSTTSNRRRRKNKPPHSDGAHETAARGSANNHRTSTGNKTHAPQTPARGDVSLFSKLPRTLHLLKRTPQNVFLDSFQTSESFFS